MECILEWGVGTFIETCFNIVEGLCATGTDTVAFVCVAFDEVKISRHIWRRRNTIPVVS